jgi:hypothetical protein
MKTCVAAVVCAIVAGAVLQGVPQGQVPSRGDLSLGGVVVDAVSQRRVAGAPVMIQGTAPLPDPPTLVADSEGRFRFDGLRPGRYTFVVSGYLTGTGQATDGLVPADITVILDDGGSRTDLRIGLIPPSSLSGVVVDSDNRPVESVELGAFRETWVAGMRRFLVESAGSSNDAGQFQFGRLSPGRYVVCALNQRLTVPQGAHALYDAAASGSPADRLAFTAMTQRGGLELGGNRGFAVGDLWLKTTSVSMGPLIDSDGQAWSAPDFCSGGSRNPLSAPMITIAAGEHRTGETLVADLDRAVTVSGDVVGPSGPVAWQGVSLESEGFDALGRVEGVPSATTTTDGAGRFTFLGIPPGTYRLRAHRVPVAPVGMPPGTPREGETLVAQADVTVGRDDLKGLSVVMAPVAQVRGRLAFAGSAEPPTAVELAKTTIALPRADGATIGYAHLRPTVTVRADGTFDTVGLLSGRHLISVPAIGPWRLDRADLDGVDVSDVPFVVGPEVTREVVITMTDAQWSLSGTVRDARAVPAAAGRVVVFPTDRTRWTGHGASPRRQRAVNVRDGAYAIDGLPPGDYFVVALPSSVTGEWQTPERFALWAATATRVTLQPRETRTVDLSFGVER